MVIKTISLAVQKIEAVYSCTGAADGNTCGRKSRGDEKQLIDLEWPNANIAVTRVTLYVAVFAQRATMPISCIELPLYA